MSFRKWKIFLSVISTVRDSAIVSYPSRKKIPSNILNTILYCPAFLVLTDAIQALKLSAFGQPLSYSSPDHEIREHDADYFLVSYSS